ncbi:MAG: FtsQ-type POTRA domain-containing protein [Kiritimatiellae bacterium]|nr:FtsQ-type POTRA domain-containing protein [Kiritimatiellia bacterium]
MTAQRNVHRPAVLRARASARPARRRRLFAFFRALLLLLLLGGLAAGVWFALPRLRLERFADSPFFTVARIDVSTDGILTPEQILHSAQVATNMNLFAASPSEIRARLEANPLVLRARVARRFPDALRIDVVERVPVARTERGNLTLSADGHVMGPRSVRTTLPLFIGLNDRALAPGDVSEDPLLPDLVAILRLADAPDLRGRFAIQALDIRDRSRIRMVLASGEEVLLSTRNYAPKLKQLPVMLAVARERGLAFHVYDMTVDRSYPAR